MANEKRLIDANARIEEIKKAHCTNCENYNGIRCRACWVDDAIGLIDDAPAVDAVEVVRCAYCDPGSRDYNPCWLCKKGGTAHDVEHCHETNYGDYEPIQPHCHLCGRKL